MRPVAAAAAALPFLASIALTAPAQAAPQPNQVTFVCENGTYDATAGSQNTASARFITSTGRGVGSVKAAAGLPLTGVPDRLLTECKILINGEPAYAEYGPLYVLLVGPGSRPAG